MSRTATSTFEVSRWDGQDWAQDITTAANMSRALMAKTFTGDLHGRSSGQFLGAQSAQEGSGTYVALESFVGELHGRGGSFGFAHSSSIAGNEVLSSLLIIVPDSGTGDLTGISGQGRIAVDDDGTHTMVLEYDLD